MLDVFYYPELSEDWTGCPAHVDPGLLTFVVADDAGLEAQFDKNWVPVFSRTAGVALAGAQWAQAASKSCQPCLHRVKLKRGASRLSAAFEIRLDSCYELPSGEGQDRNSNEAEKKPSASDVNRAMEKKKK